MIDRAAKWGIIKKNTAARYKSRLTCDSRSSLPRNRFLCTCFHSGRGSAYHQQYADLSRISFFVGLARPGPSPGTGNGCHQRSALWEQVGQQPYEFTWTARAEHPATLVDFENLSGWKLECYAGAKGEFRRSREQQMWGQHTAKFLFSGASEQSRVVARPAKADPDSRRVRLGRDVGLRQPLGLGGRQDPRRRSPIAVLVARRTRQGAPHRDHRHQLETVVADPPQAAAPQIAADLVLPASFSGIEISKIANTEPRYFFCDSLALFTGRTEAAVDFKPQPKRNLKPYRGQIAGLNTGEGTLPFPTREETILPANFEKKFQTTVAAMRTQSFRTSLPGARCHAALHLLAGSRARWAKSRRR